MNREAEGVEEVVPLWLKCSPLPFPVPETRNFTRNLVRDTASTLLVKVVCCCTFIVPLQARPGYDSQMAVQLINCTEFSIFMIAQWKCRIRGLGSYA